MEVVFIGRSQEVILCFPLITVLDLFFFPRFICHDEDTVGLKKEVMEVRLAPTHRHQRLGRTGAATGSAFYFTSMCCRRLTAACDLQWLHPPSAGVVVPQYMQACEFSPNSDFSLASALDSFCYVHVLDVFVEFHWCLLMHLRELDSENFCLLSLCLSSKLIFLFSCNPLKIK